MLCNTKSTFPPKCSIVFRWYVFRFRNRDLRALNHNGIGLGTSWRGFCRRLGRQRERALAPQPLGVDLARQTPIDIDIYFTHTHLDHITGLTFFAPLFDKRNSVRMWAGHLEAPYTLKKVVSNLMQAPIYPVTLDVFKAKDIESAARVSTLLRTCPDRNLDGYGVGPVQGNHSHVAQIRMITS